MRSAIAATLVVAAAACHTESSQVADASGGDDAPGDASVDTPPPDGLDPFDITRIHDIAIELPAASVAAIDAEARPPGICSYIERDYYTGTMTFDGVRFEGVGVRARGNGTADTLEGKPSLKINLGWDDPAIAGCPISRRIGGKKKLNLINMRQDPSFVRIPLAGEIDRLFGVPQPRTSYGRLTINGAYTGIVVIAENIDRQFLGEWFTSNDGMMYESGCHCEVTPSNVPAPTDPDGARCFTRDFTPDTCSTPDPGSDPMDWEMLRQFTDRLAGLSSFYPAIESFFDFDGFLSLWATQMFLGTGDGYFLNQNSYRIYHDPQADKFAMIDHGSADGVMRTFSDTCSPQGLLQRGGATDVFADSPSLLVQRCLAEPACKSAYAARMWTVVHGLEAFGLRARAQQLHDFILPEAAADPRYYYAACFDQSANLHYYTWPEIEAHFTDYVLPWIDTRFAQVRDQLIAAGYPEP